MVYYIAIFIFLLPIVTTLVDDFWNDVDKLNDELSSPRDLPTQTTTNDAQQVGSTTAAPHPAPSPNKTDEKHLERQRHSIRKYFRKYVTVCGEEVETFEQTIITDLSYPQNISLEEIENKLLSLEGLHEWYDLYTFDVDKYSKYWGKVCVLFWGKPLAKTQRYACVISPSYGVDNMRILHIGNMILYLDLLSCKCHKYERNYKINVSIPELFLIHKSSLNEYFVFELNEPPKNNRYNLSIKDFKGGITLPVPVDGEHSRSSKFFEKQVALSPLDIHCFRKALRIDNSYPKNTSSAAVEDRLKQFEDVQEWSNLQKYDVDKYSRYWAKVCVSFWGKELDSSHRQLCMISPSYGINRMRKLFLSGKILHFDLLYCKCYSYTKNYKRRETASDTFLIHQISVNEYIVFEQRATQNTTYTLMIKDFKGGIILPDPDIFNN